MSGRSILVYCTRDVPQLCVGLFRRVDVLDGDVSSDSLKGWRTLCQAGDGIRAIVAHRVIRPDARGEQSAIIDICCSVTTASTLRTVSAIAAISRCAMAPRVRSPASGTSAAPTAPASLSASPPPAPRWPATCPLAAAPGAARWPPSRAYAARYRPPALSPARCRCRHPSRPTAAPGPQSAPAPPAEAIADPKISDTPCSETCRHSTPRPRRLPWRPPLLNSLLGWKFGNEKQNTIGKNVLMVWISLKVGHPFFQAVTTSRRCFATLLAQSVSPVQHVSKTPTGGYRTRVKVRIFPGINEPVYENR